MLDSVREIIESAADVRAQYWTSMIIIGFVAVMTLSYLMTASHRSQSNYDKLSLRYHRAASVLWIAGLTSMFAGVAVACQISHDPQRALSGLMALTLLGGYAMFLARYFGDQVESA